MLSEGKREEESDVASDGDILTLMVVVVLMGRVADRVKIGCYSRQSWVDWAT